MVNHQKTQSSYEKFPGDQNVKNGYDIIFIARVSCNEAEYKDIDKAINHLVKKSNLIDK